LDLCKLGKQLGFFERLFTGGVALGPQRTELSHFFLNGAVDALCVLYMESQQLKVFALGEPGAGSREGFVDGKLGRVVPVVRDEGAESAELTKSEDAGFEGTGAFEAPMVFGDG
jgi:hypothetical protein